MTLIPYENLNIKTTLDLAKVLEKLNEAIEPKQRFRKFWDASHKPYQGAVDGLHFDATRIIHYRNSFLPIIKGEIQPEINGCTINLKMHLHTAVVIFMTLWLGFVAFFFLAILGSYISTILQTGTAGASSPMMFFIPGAMFVFGYGLVLGSFKFESKRSKAYFYELFQAYEIEEATTD